MTDQSSPPPTPEEPKKLEARMANGGGGSIARGILIGAGALVLGTLALTAIANVTNWFDWLLRPSVPDGAVMALDDEKGCPNGWVDMGEAWGKKTLVVAVDQADPKYGYRKTGGAETHVLTPDELPAHSHTHKDWTLKSNSARHIDTQPDPGLNTDVDVIDRETSIIGKATAHNNMPPYIALYFCKKEG